MQAYMCMHACMSVPMYVCALVSVHVSMNVCACVWQGPCHLGTLADTSTG